jgi:hypothetical protein
MNIKQSIFIDPTAIRENIFLISKDISALKEYLRQHPKELYATPQLLEESIPKSIVVLRTIKGHKVSFTTMINPQILERIEKIAVEETQAQVEGTYLNIRHPKITVAYLALPAVEPVNVTLQGKAAIMFQQAYSLLQGIPISLLGLRIDGYKEYNEGTEEDKMKIISSYIEALKEIFAQSKEDKEVKDYVDAAEFVSEKIGRSVDNELKEQIKEMEELIKEDEQREI